MRRAYTKFSLTLVLQSIPFSNGFQYFNTNNVCQFIFYGLKFLIVWSSFMPIISVNRNNEGKSRVMVLKSMFQYNINIISSQDFENICPDFYLLVNIRIFEGFNILINYHLPIHLCLFVYLCIYVSIYVPM